MQRHPEIGEQLCAPLRSLAEARTIVRSHHERLDGSGYPDRLVGDAVPLLAQIVGAVDVFDALTSPRHYRRPLSVDEAAAHLRREVTEGKFDRGLVERFLTSVIGMDSIDLHTHVRARPRGA